MELTVADLNIMILFIACVSFTIVSLLITKPKKLEYKDTLYSHGYPMFLYLKYPSETLLKNSKLDFKFEPTLFTMEGKFYQIKLNIWLKTEDKKIAFYFTQSYDQITRKKKELREEEIPYKYNVVGTFKIPSQNLILLKPVNVDPDNKLETIQDDAYRVICCTRIMNKMGDHYNDELCYMIRVHVDECSLTQYDVFTNLVEKSQ